ncbi:MAG: bifunctional lysylphosphatidylglycerol flippase/synthetase MprF [Desulfuromonadales bacterium]
MVSAKVQSRSLAHRLSPLLALVLFGVALWVLHDVLHQFHYHQIVAQLKTLPASKILMALGLTVLSYLTLTVYDRLAIAYVGHPLAAGKVTLAAFISYAFSNTMSLSLLTAGTIRYRLYSSWGLSAEEIAQLVMFTVLTFWLGLLAVASVIFIVEPLSMPILQYVSIHSALPFGILFATLVITYLLIVAVRKAPLRFRRWEFSIPSPRLAGTQLLVGSLDWTLACSVLFVLLPSQSGLSFLQFLGIFLLAQIVALISHVPAGLGVFETMILISSPGISADALLGSILVYRALYYLLPLTVAALLLSGNELLERRSLFKKAVRLAGHWGGALIPQLLAATTLLSGAVLLFSASTPALPDRLRWLREFLPLPAIELSHFLGSLVGACLLLLARGLQRRLNAAYGLASILLGAGILFSLLKGADYEEALFLSLMLLALLPCRRHFYRKTSLLNESFGLGWNVTVLLVLACATWLGIFAYKHVAYSNELWWNFTLYGDAPRFMRAAVGAATLLLLFALAKLLRPVAKNPERPDADQLTKARVVLDQASRTQANLALLGDKTLMFDDQQKGFVMYGVEGHSWVALGDPLGPPEVARDLAWTYRAMVEQHGGQTIFYEIGTDMLNVYLDMGLTLLKLGEEAMVPLSEFSLEGSKRKGLRYTHNRLNRLGCSFEVQPADKLDDMLPDLKRISDAWLQEINTREKGFSLGYFDSEYLRNFPVAIVKKQNEIVAFANIWTTSARQELSIDLMRFDREAENGVMEYLFINLMLWGKEQGYRFFDLGMAPLSGMENRPFAPLWHRIGALIFRHGEHFYNFEGLREYKQKFNPIWEPRYLAYPGGLALPRILLNISTLISGGLKGVITK